MFFVLVNTQNEVSKELESLCISRRLPASLLFSGPVFSSRMFAARAVAKFYKSDETCTIIISDRDYSLRIKTLLNLYKSCKSEEKLTSVASFLKETVQEFLMQYNGVLLDNATGTQKKSFTDASECAELIKTIDNVGLKEAGAFVKKLEKPLSALKTGKAGTISVNQIRSIKSWCNTSSLENKRKVVIVEGLENTTPSCSNALLKVVEEPPQSTTFIVITENAGRIPQTILSRVRKFTFKSFTDTEKNYVLSLIGENGEDYRNLKSFFIAGSGINYALLSEAAQNLVRGKKVDLVSLVTELEASDSYDVFFEVLTDKLRDRYLELLSARQNALQGVSNAPASDSITGGAHSVVIDGTVSDAPANYSVSPAQLSEAFKLQKLTGDIEKAIIRGKTLNQSSRLTLEYVLYRFARIE